MERELNQWRSKLDGIDKRLLRKCRDELWPPEPQWKNRAAKKLHQLNQIFNHAIVNQNDTRCFVDLCGGPGGFTDYTLAHCHKQAKGFGMTLRQENNFDSKEKRFAMSYGADGTGNICNPDNIRHFVNLCNKTPVDVVLADGAFDTEGNENEQERLHARLILAEILIACLLRPRIFVCKFFDCFTLSTQSYLHFLLDHFSSVQIEKPQHSRPANSERYVVCRHYQKELTKTETEVLFQHLSSTSSTTPNIILPYTSRSSSSSSFSSTNAEITQMQIRALKQLVARIITS